MTARVLVYRPRHGLNQAQPTIGLIELLDAVVQAVQAIDPMFNGTSLCGSSKAGIKVAARMVLVYRARTTLGLSYPEITSVLGGGGHSSARGAYEHYMRGCGPYAGLVRKIERLMPAMKAEPPVIHPDLGGNLEMQRKLLASLSRGGHGEPQAIRTGPSGGQGEQEGADVCA